jgi:tetraacyldisaccharide 4'-kinase
LLRPLVPLYETVIAAKEELLQRGWVQQKRLRHPVISVGSLSAGGAGKTPVVLMLAELLGRRGFEVRILTRGYGRRSRIVQRVDPDWNDAGAARQYGDEPLMLARRLAASVPRASVWVGADRHRAGSLAEKNEAPGTKVVYLLDDGFQHRGLARDLDVVLMTRQDFGDESLPAGNLREPLKASSRADVIVVREDEAFAGRFSGKAKTWTVRRQLRFGANADAAPSHPWLFCGLARPESFQNMLAAAGTTIAGTSVFRDHHAYSAADVERLVRAAVAAGADGFVTTQKDAVKLSVAMLERLRSVGPIVVPELQVTLLNESACMDELLEMLLARFASSRG